VRTTVDIKPEQYKALQELASRRGDKPVSALVAEAIDHYLGNDIKPSVRNDEFLSLAGSLSKPEADELRQRVKALRRHWR
jgi:hypothetical protein